MDTPSPEDITDYQLALRWISDRINYERTRPSRHSNPFRLERIERMLGLIGAPQQRIPVIHIAGTKGKGSTAAMLSAVLQRAGIHHGLFTSPHISQLEERMRVDGCMPGPQRLTRLVADLAERLSHSPAVADREPTFFEVTTLLAWMLFDQENVEVVVLETGLGGRLDCTNVCRPLVTMITSIGLDHTQILGNTLPQIAAEKAGILKPGIPVVEGQLPESAANVVSETALRLSCPHYRFGRDFSVVAEPRAAPATASGMRSCPFSVITRDRRLENLTVPLYGDHQIRNASLVVMAADLLGRTQFPGITTDRIREGLAATWWPLRFEVIPGRPCHILDAAHNPDSITALTDALRHYSAPPGPRVLIFAASADKDAAAMLQIALPQFDQVILTRYLTNPRCISPAVLAELCRTIIRGTTPQIAVVADPLTALREADDTAGPDGLVCASGSLFLAAEVRALLPGCPPMFRTMEATEREGD